MEYFALILIPLLVHVLYTDFRHYQVHMSVLVLLIATSVTRLLIVQPLGSIFPGLALNIILLGILFSVIFLVSRLKGKKVQQMIGSGDIIFFVVASLNFAPVWFDVYILSTAFAAIIFLLIRLPFNKMEKRVPYAGIMSFVLIGFLLLDVFSGFSCYNDNSVLTFLVR